MPMCGSRTRCSAKSARSSARSRSPRSSRRTAILQRFEAIAVQVRERVSGYAGSALGIEVVAVQLLHLTLPEQNRTPVFERMKAERGKIAKEYRTAGELLSRKIIAEADHEKTRIDAEAYAKAQRLRAEGDAEAARVYATAFSRNPGFYKFQRSLKAYEKFLDEQTTLFLPADAEVLRVLRIQPGQAGAPAADRTGSPPARNRRSPVRSCRWPSAGAGRGLRAPAELSSRTERRAQ